MGISTRVALITGGASGIGLAVSERLVQTGWKVAIVDLNAATGAEVAHKLGDGAIFIEGNTTNYTHQAKAFARAWEKWGQLDLVYANAGIVDRADFCRPAAGNGPDGAPTQPDTMVVDVDLTGVIYSSYLALHYFRKNQSKGGKLIMTSSSAGLYPLGEIPLYAAAKHGVVGLAKSLARRMQDEKEPITVNAICPGMVPTNIVSPEMIALFPKEMITPTSTIVRAIEDIISDDSLTGQAFECSGEEIAARPTLPFLNKASEFTAGGGYKNTIDASDIQSYSERKAKEMGL